MDGIVYNVIDGVNIHTDVLFCPIYLKKKKHLVCYMGSDVVTIVANALILTVKRVEGGCAIPPPKTTH